MDSLASISPSMVLPPNNLLSLQRRSATFPCSSSSHNHQRYLNLLLPRVASSFADPNSFRRRGRRFSFRANAGRGGGGEDKRAGSGGGEGDDDQEELERALHLDGTIPGTSDEFVKQVSSRAYDMRRHLQQTFDSSTYDVLESNPWRDPSKPVYVLIHRDNQLCTMKTRRNVSEVERELGMLFSKGKRRPDMGNQAKKSRPGTKFQMHVEDVREGVLVFEDENEAARYCDLLQGGGKGCEGVAEIEASSVFDLCRKMRGLAVVFRRGTTPPMPQSLELNLKARKRSLEDQEEDAA
ncbi:unnamed protein product [Linum trigynum]|uniref:Uncharacterized protein n=1 Tax=Linum trigynum TaxID=586398 RepID=A0AAV2CVI8_9ROSI